MSEESTGLSQELEEKLVSLHGNSVTIVWLSVAIIGLWSQAFKQYKWANWLHTAAMTVVIIITLISGAIAVNALDDVEVSGFHKNLGGVLLAGVVIQGVCGAIAWGLQASSRVRPDIVAYSNTVHHLLGYLLIILVAVELIQISLSTQIKILYATIIIDVIAVIAYLLFRFLRPRMQNYNSIATNGPNEELIKSYRDLAKLHGNYFIFADKVYNLDKVITNHPGGFQVINHIRGREVDRYIYGSEALESVGHMKVHNHTAASMAMAGDPIGILVSHNPFQNMFQINDVKLHKLALPCRSKYIYAPYLAASQKQFIFKGYSNVSQLGKYFTVTINNKKTRLYSCTNFLHQTNIQLMGRVTGRSIQVIPSQVNYNQQMNEMQTSDRNMTINWNTIPLLIKKYDKGAFTTEFLTQGYNKNIKVSPPRGRGLSLHEIRPGHVVILAGGTGLFPFCDTIDILYKQMLVSQNHIYSRQIILKNPIVEERILSTKFKFTALISVQDIGDIHEITLLQLNELAANHIIDARIRINQNPQSLSKNYHSIQSIDKRFEQYLPQLVINLHDISQIFICGPPVMSTALVKAMDMLNVPQEKYYIL